MEKFSELKRDCRKRTGNKLEHWCVPMCYLYFTVDVSWNAETSHCLTNFYTHGNNLIPISVLKILVHIVLFCLARTVKLRCFFTEVSDCKLM